MIQSLRASLAVVYHGMVVEGSASGVADMRCIVSSKFKNNANNLTVGLLSTHSSQPCGDKRHLEKI